MSDSLWPHEPQHARPPCPSPTPGVHPHPCPLSQWCHPTISSSVIPFSSCPQSFPASGSFPVSQLFASGGQTIGVSASTSVLPMNTQDWSPLGWTGWISLQSKGLSRVFSNTTVQKHQFFGAQLSLSAVSFQLSWLEMLRAWTNTVLWGWRGPTDSKDCPELELTGIGVTVKVKKRRRGHDGPERLDVDTIKIMVSFKGRKGF